MNVLWGEAPALILPDTTYYEEGNEKGPELLAIWRQMMEKLLPKFEFSEAEIKKISWIRSLRSDAELAKYVLSNEERSEYNKLYHPYEWADFKALVPELPLDAFFTEVIGQTPDKIIVPEERFWKEFAPTFYSAANWETIHARLKLSAAVDWTLFLTEEIRVLSGEYGRTISGIPEPRQKKRRPCLWQKVPYSQALGLWYAGEKFSPEAKADVEHKVATMIEVLHKDRLEKADWLAPETREKPLSNSMSSHRILVTLKSYQKLMPRRLSTRAKPWLKMLRALYEISLPIAGASGTNRLIEANGTCQPTWSMPTMIRNKNQIVFPAAILQAPFYDLHQSSSANYGGIGAVIAHEIPTPLIPMVLPLMKHGSLKDWWKPEDYEAFTARTQKSHRSV